MAAKTAGVLSGIVDLSRYGHSDLGVVKIGTNFTRDLLKAGQDSLSSTVKGADYGEVFDTILGVLPLDKEVLGWTTIQPFMDLLSFDAVEEFFVDKNPQLYNIIKERAFLNTVMNLDESLFTNLFDQGTNVLGELDHIFAMEDKLLSLSTTREAELIKSLDLKGFLNNVIPVDKLESLEVIREFVPFLFKQVASMNEKMTSVKDRLLERAGLDVTKKQALGLLEYALKVAPTKFKENICLKDTCSENVVEGLEDVIELHPVVAGILSERVNFKDVINRPVTFAGAEEFLSSVFLTTPKGIITELIDVYGSLDGITTIGLLTTGVSHVAEKQNKNDIFDLNLNSLHVTAANIFGSDVFNVESLVKESKIINIPELGSIISLKNGFLVDSIDSVIAAKIKSGELFKEFSFQLADGSTSGDFIKKLTEEKGAINIVAMDTFPGQLEMFKGIIVELSKVQGMFEIFSEKFRLDERFTIQDFAHMLESLTARFSSLGSPP